MENAGKYLRNSLNKLETYYDIIKREGLITYKNNFKYYLKFLFRDVSTFKKIKMLDIGSGSGLYSFYAACNEAYKVVCLEPESDGSNKHAIDKFYKISKILELNNIILKKNTIQEYDEEGERFDLILLHNSINHLNENACIKILYDYKSQESYNAIFYKIKNLMKDNGKIIIADCSPDNFWGKRNIKNLFVPNIEWHKHQSPELWYKMMSSHEFYNPKIYWTSFSRAGKWGNLFLGHKSIAYFLMSHFILVMNKRPTQKKNV